MLRRLVSGVFFCLLADAAGGADVRLRVVDPLDQPIPEARVRLLTVGDRPRLVTPFLFRTGKSGEIDVVGLEPGRYQARIHAPRRKRRALVAVREFEVESAAVVQAHTFVLGLDPWAGNEKQFRISGKMIGERRLEDALYWLLFRRVNRDDEPVQGFMVNEEGRFTVPAIGAGNYHIFCRVSDKVITTAYREYFLGDVNVDRDISDMVLSWYERVR